jgi:hypothetical protein
MSDRPSLDVSILIVSYNTKALTLAAIASAKVETQASRYEIIVVDNASSDGSADAIAAVHPDVHLVRSDLNLGFAGANNQAAELASGRYLLLLNPDTIVLGGAIDRLIAFARRWPEARIWGGRTLFPDGRLNPSSCWARMTPWNLICRASGLTGLFPNHELTNGEAYGGWQRDSEREVDIVSGCFLLIQRRDWRRLGGFDPAFFMYGEEADLCLRARQAIAARPAVTPHATIIHHGGASEATRSAKMVKLLAAKATLIRRHWPPLTAGLGLLLLEAWPRSRALALAAAALLTGRSALGAAADVWREIAAAAPGWRLGYGEAGAIGWAVHRGRGQIGAGV